MLLRNTGTRNKFPIFIIPHEELSIDFFRTSVYPSRGDRLYTHCAVIEMPRPDEELRPRLSFAQLLQCPPPKSCRELGKERAKKV